MNYINKQSASGVTRKPCIHHTSYNLAFRHTRLLIEWRHFAETRKAGASTKQRQRAASPPTTLSEPNLFVVQVCIGNRLLEETWRENKNTVCPNMLIKVINGGLTAGQNWKAEPVITCLPHENNVGSDCFYRFNRSTPVCCRGPNLTFVSVFLYC